MTQTNLDKEINKSLSIQISLNGLSFCILDLPTNTITKIEHIVFNKKQTPFELLEAITKVFNTESELKNNFETVNVVHINELATLVPEPLFEEDAIADYLKLNTKILKTDFITFDTITINNTVNVYIPFVNINNFIFERFGDFTYKHYSTILIEKILATEINAEDSKVYIHVLKTHFEIVVVNSGKLQFYNTFEYATPQDFIYYILFTIEQLKFNPETINLILLGEITKDDEYYTILYKYVRRVNFGDRQTNYNFTLKQEDTHSHFILLNNF